MTAPRAPIDATGPTHMDVVAAAISTLAATLAVARALADSGRRIDLDGLEGDAVALCVALMALDAAEARGLRPAMEALRRDVDSLAATIRVA